MDCKSCCPPGVSSCDACCKCGPGWTCVIRKLETSETSSKPFYNCGTAACVCITAEKQQVGEQAGKKEGVEGEGACCECGEGYACTTTLTQGPDAGKVLFECGNGCKCELPGFAAAGVVLK